MKSKWVDLLQDHCQAAATLMQRLSGFDRAIAYRFDAELSGEVIAEAAQECSGLVEATAAAIRDATAAITT